MLHPGRILGQIWPPVLLAGLALLVYWQMAGHQYVHFDDLDYIVHNVLVRRGLTWPGLAAAFSLDSAHSYWHPLTWLSLMAGVEWLGYSPVATLGVNAALHWITACLLWLFLAQATGRSAVSLLAATLFLLHPLNVESVAWAVERKTVLMGVCVMLALHAHHWQARRPGPWPMAATAVCLALALMAKAAAVVTPVMLLIMDIWPLQRRGGVQRVPWRRLVLEKVPLLCLVVGASILAVASRQDVTAGVEAGERPLGLRLANALVAMARYLERVVWPQDLSVYYPYPESLPAWQWIGATALLVAVTMLVVHARRDRPWLLASWLWFLAGLAPASGLVQTGLWPAMADRFAYLSLMGLCWMAAFGLADLVRGRARVLLAALLCAYLALFAWAQVGVWRDGVSLFTQARRLYPDDFVVNQQLGFALYRQGRLEEAEQAFAKTMELAPAYMPAHKMLALTRQRLGDLDGSERVLRWAMEMSPTYADGCMVLGNLLLERGEVAEALVMLRRAVQYAPGFSPAYYNLGLGLTRSGDLIGAEQALRRALSLRPGEPAVLVALGRVLTDVGRAAESADILGSAMVAEPGNAQGHEALAEALVALGRNVEARDHKELAQRIRHKDAVAFVALAREQDAAGRHDDAAASFRQALELEPGLPEAVQGLANSRSAGGKSTD
ncbi:MAG: tetratricopeptide repeat protein [Thermodesulfobacteriota bacterium]